MKSRMEWTNFELVSLKKERSKREGFNESFRSSSKAFTLVIFSILVDTAMTRKCEKEREHG